MCILTMIRGEHHYSAVSQPQLIKGAEQPANLSVHVRHSSVVVLTNTQLEDRTYSTVVLVLVLEKGHTLSAEAASSYLEVCGNRSIGEADVESLDVLPLSYICPWVVGHGRKPFGDIRVRGLGHLMQGIQAQVLL